uniref:Uncharacterized protein n=1 Tax=Chenopodium quinoa TaxID=63459 RepID=A0A803M742_CHEQI
MSSYTKSSKVVHTESMLDEYNIYFSHVLAPLKKINRKAECSKRMEMMQMQHDEDVDAKAQEYIKKRHQKFALGKWPGCNL